MASASSATVFIATSITTTGDLFAVDARGLAPAMHGGICGEARASSPCRSPPIYALLPNDERLDVLEHGGAGSRVMDVADGGEAKKEGEFGVETSEMRMLLFMAIIPRFSVAIEEGELRLRKLYAAMDCGDNGKCEITEEDYLIKRMINTVGEFLGGLL